MATLARGKTFGTTEEVTAAKLHSLVDDGSVSGITQADLAAGEGLVKSGTSSPSDVDQWLRHTGMDLGMISDGSNFIPVGRGDRLTNKSGDGVVLGDLVVADTTTDSSFTTTTTANDQTVIGAAAETIANDAAGVVKRSGVVTVLVDNTVSRGDFLVSSTTAKRADGTATYAKGAFAIALTAASQGSTVQAMMIGIGTANPATVQVGIVRGSKAWTASNGLVAYTGMGFEADVILYFCSGAWGAGGTGVSFGISTGAATGECTAGGVNTAGGFTESAKVIRVTDTTPTGQSAAQSAIGSDGFSLTWTQHGSPSAGTFYFTAIGLKFT